MKIDDDVAALSVFGDDNSSWTRSRYARLCAYAHSQGGYNNAGFWESNGPIFVPRALAVVEQEFQETLALSYLLFAWAGQHTDLVLARRPSSQAWGLAGRSTKTSCAPGWGWTNHGGYAACK